MKRGVERLSDAFERAHPDLFKKVHQFAMHEPNLFDKRLVVFGELQQTFQIVHNVQERQDKSSQRFPAGMRTLAIHTAAIIIKVGKRPKIEAVFCFQVLFDIFNCAFHGYPAFLKSASTTSSGPPESSCRACSVCWGWLPQPQVSPSKPNRPGRTTPVVRMTSSMRTSRRRKRICCKSPVSCFNCAMSVDCVRTSS